MRSDSKLSNMHSILEFNKSDAVLRAGRAAKPVSPKVADLSGLVTAALLYLALLLTASGALGAGPTGARPAAAMRAEKLFLTNRVRFQNDRSNVEAAWKFARACFDWAEVATSNEQREEIARQGIEAARRGIARYTDSAEAHYYLAMNLGQFAKTRGIGALKIVHEMEREFKTAIDLDEKLDYAGPHRSLGLLYRDAPGWPTSIGSKAKARAELERATQLFPEHPDNRLSLAEAYAKWGERRSLQSEMDTLKGLLPKARQQFTGEQWAANWADWDARWEKLQRPAPEKVAPRRIR